MARSSLGAERMAVSFPIVAAVLVFLAFIVPKSISASKQGSNENNQ